MEQNVCQTCLSRDRLLTPISHIHELIRQLDVFKVVKSCGGVCWECNHILNKFYNFQQQAQKAQNILKNKLKYQESLSSLTTKIKAVYDHEFIDSLATEKNIELLNIKNETIDLYKEIKLDDSFNSRNVSVSLEKTTCNESIDEDSKDLAQSNEVFVDKLQIDEHVEKRIKKRKIKKEFAKKSFNSNNRFNDDEIKQKIAIKVFTVDEMLKNREEKRCQPNFKKIPYKCESCVLGFTRLDTFQMHLDKKHNEKIGCFVCDICKVRFPGKRLLERHCKRHFTVYKCRLCQYESVELSSAQKHCKLKHCYDTVNKIHCKQCSFVSRNPEELSDHVRSQHSLSCDECGEKFKGKNTLRTHKVRIHGQKRDFTCEICRKSFNTKSRLESHASSHSAALAQTLAFCTMCNIQYKNIRVYRNHIQNSAAHGNNKYTCPDCNKIFASKVYWNKHYKFYHLKKSQYKCESCNKLFISDWRLKNHKQKHHGLSRSRDHACSVCGKKFYTVSTLRAHQLTHSEHRSYMCEDCGDTFKQRPALYNHAKLVHKGVKRGK